MYPSDWGLAEPPFPVKSFFESPSHEEAMARLHFLVERGRRFGLLLGGAGSGKSLLLNVFRRQMLADGKHAAHLNLLDADADELFWRLGEALGRIPAPGEASFVVRESLRDRIQELCWEEKDVVLLLDDVDEAQPTARKALAQLSNWNPNGAGNLVVVLAADGSRAETLGDRLLNLVELRIDLDPWEVADTIEFLEFALSAAGGDPQLFDDAAMRQLHNIAGGNPRRLNQLADMALATAAANEQDRVDEDSVAIAVEELSLP